MFWFIDKYIFVKHPITIKRVTYKNTGESKSNFYGEMHLLTMTRMKAFNSKD